MVISGIPPCVHPSSHACCRLRHFYPALVRTGRIAFPPRHVPSPDVPAVLRRAGDQPGRGLRLLRRPPVAGPRPDRFRGGPWRGGLDVLRGPVDPPPRGRGAHGPRPPPHPRGPLRHAPGSPRGRRGGLRRGGHHHDRPHVRLRRPPRGEAEPVGPGQGREGWRYTARVPWLWITILVFAIVNAAEAGPRGVVLPAFVALDLRGGPTAIGLVLSTMAAGSLLGFFLPNFLPPIRHRGLVAYVATALFGVSITLMAFSPNLIGILGLGFLHGVAVAVFSLMWQTAMMEQVREDIRGRVFSLDELGSFALLPFSFFACGVLAVLVGPRIVLLGGGLIVMLCAAAGLLYPPAHTFEGTPPHVSK